MKKSITQKTFNSIHIKSAMQVVASCIAFLFFAANAGASKIDDLKKIENYLNNLKYLSANFTQKTADSKTEGKFFLSRPGKMRVEYKKNPQILIVVNDAVLTYKDIELDEVSSLATNTTPASFLTRNNISFEAKDVAITHYENNGDFIKVSVVKKNRKEAGEFSLIFSNNPFEFYKMEVKNDLGEITEITLHNIDFETKLSDNLFYIKNKNLSF